MASFQNSEKECQLPCCDMTSHSHAIFHVWLFPTQFAGT